MASYTDYFELYDRGPYAPYLKERRSAGSAPVRLLSAAKPAGQYPDPPVADPVLILGRRLSPAPARLDLGAGAWRGRLEPGSIVLQPPETATFTEVERSFEILVLSIPISAFRGTAADITSNFTGDFGRLHAAPFRDPFVEGLCRRLWDESAQGSPLGAMFADSAIQTLALALLRSAELVEGMTEPARGAPLAPWRLQRCLNYIGDNLGEDIGLAELAAAAGLSSFHFARAFKRTTGLAPHQYLIGQRIERAKELLAGSDLPLAEVALACGFAHQSHLSQAFKRAVGVAPGAYRKERLA